MKLIDFFKIDNSFKASKISLLLTAVIGFISYDLLIAYRVVNPDAIIEGITYYINATWAIEGCGRWLMPVVNMLSGNLIMPPYVVLMYCLCMWLCSIIICKLWRINKPLYITIISICLTVTPTTIFQLVTTYMSLCFACSCLLATLFVYFCFEKNNKLSYVLCIISIILSLALYQSYLSHAAALTLMTLALSLFQNVDGKTIVNKTLKAFITALLGSVLYFISNKVILIVLNLESSSRLANFAFNKIFEDLGSHILKIYNAYFNFLNDSVLLRKYLYLFLVAVICIISINYLCKKDNKTFNKLLYSLSLSLIPLASGIISLITPDNPITVLMTYQYILIIPFAFALVNYSKIDFTKYIVIIASLLLCWTHIISANATFESYKLTHDYIYNQYSQVVYDVEHCDGYVKDETPVLIAGFFDNKTLINNIKTFNYSIKLYDDSQLAFWNTLGGATYNRHRYVLQYFGLDFIDFSIDEYQKIINTNEFKSMPLWPNKDGIKFIDEYLVVKINNNYVE